MKKSIVVDYIFFYKKLFSKVIKRINSLINEFNESEAVKKKNCKTIFDDSDSDEESEKISESDNESREESDYESDDNSDNESNEDSDESDEE